MIVADGVSIKNGDTRHKYSSALAEYMDHLCGIGGQDRDTGGGDGFTFYAQFGKRIMTCDEQGFVDVITFANEDDANSAFREADEAYWAWCAAADEDQCAELFEVVAELTVDPAYLAYCAECEAELCEPHTLHMWRMHEQPNGPI